nr:hypothetical protein CFP56_17149 [Quercus suber]
MLDGIWIKIMGRLNKRFEKANTLDSLVTPKIKKTLHLIQQDSTFCKVIVAGDDEYQVVDGFTTFVVNLIVKTYACGYWKISGLSCKHVVAFIVHKRANVETYCDEYLTRFIYLKAYGEIIHPLPDLNDITADEEVEPPILRRTRESSGVGACANVMINFIKNVVEDGLDATAQQNVNGAATGMNEFTPLANDEPSGSDYATF